MGNNGKMGRRSKKLARVDVPTFDHLSEATIVADQHGSILYANPACESLLGWRPELLVGQQLVSLVPERLHAAHLSAFERRVSSGEGRLIGRPVGVPALRPDGSEVPTELLISLVGDATAPMFVGTMRAATAPTDVDQNALLAQALLRVLSGPADLRAAPRELLAAIGEALGWDATALWVVDGGEVRLRCDEFWGPDMARFEGATRAALLPPGVDLPGRAWEHGRGIWIDDLSADANFPRARAASADGVRSGVAFPLAAGGRFVGVVECFQRAARAEDPVVLATMAGVGQLLGSIVDRGHSEEERARLLDQVQTERSRLGAVLRQLPLGVVITDADGEVVLANAEVDRLLGPIPADRRYRVASLGASTVPGSSPMPGPRVEEIEVCTPAGIAAAVEVSSVEVHDRVGGVVSRVSTLVDVTERRSEQERLELLAEAGEILARSLDLEETLAALAQASVPRLGDVCLVDLVDQGGEVHRVATALADPAQQALWAQLERSHRVDLSGAEGVARVLRTGRPATYEQVTDEQLQRRARDGEHLSLLRALELSSVVIVPLTGRNRTVGALTYVWLHGAGTVSQRELDLAAELGRRTGLTVVNAQLYERAREVSETLQASLLPPSLPQPPGLDLGACFLAGGEGLIVGGDFYDVSQLDDGRWAVTIGDVCGTGAEAAAVTARVRYTARAAEERAEPAALLGRINRVLRDEAREGSRFCTVAHAVLEVCADEVKVLLAVGGHPPPVVVDAAGRVTEVPCRGKLLGVFDGVDHVETRLVLRPGDTLVLFTDGVIEARSPSGLFGDEGLRRVLVATAGRPAAAIAEAIGEAVVQHGAGRTSDDVAVVVVRAVPHEAEA